MATADYIKDRSATESDIAVGPLVEKLMRPLASLKLTVALLSMATFLVLAGTMAQVNSDIWEVVEKYFRCNLAWIDLQIFFPPSFFPSKPNVPDWMVIPFPGGRLIGVVMFLNLLAAHGIRFKSQAKGNRLWAGVGVIGLGLLTTWTVVVSGSNADGLQSDSWISWNAIWLLFKFVLTGIWGYTVYETVRIDSSEKSDAESRKPIPFWVKATGCTAGGLLLAWLWVWGNVLDDSSMRILWQLLKGTLSGVVLLIGCVMVFKKRAGIVLLHAGIGLMMFSELLVGLLAVEGQISLEEGEKTNYARDIRSAELAIIESAGTDSETHVVVPASRLARGIGKDRIVNDLLPFDIEVLEFHKNARVRRAEGDTKIVATAGIGKTNVLVPIEASTGVETDGDNVDRAGAYVRLTKRAGGEEIGTYLVGVHLAEQNISESIEIGDKKYDLSLRFRRDYKPYTVELKDVDGTNYLGTSTARNYSSDIRVVDESRGKDFEHHVWMNNPLRYAGETFYQSSYTQAGGKEYTTLAVVTNSGWMIPYVACMIVAVGMLFQFSVTLLRFLDRRDRESKTATVAEFVSGAVRWTPIVVVAFLGLWVGSKAKPPALKSNTFDYAAVGHLPVVVDGRVKPLDTYARNMLRIVSGSETFKFEYEENGKTKTRTEPAIRWLMDMIAQPSVAKHHKVIRIDNLEVIKALNLQARKGFRYSLAEIIAQPDEIDANGKRLVEDSETRVAKLTKKADEASAKDTKNLSVEDRKAIEFDRKSGLYGSLLRFADTPRVEAQSPLDLMDRAVDFHAALKRSRLPFVLPPLPGSDDQDQWDYLPLAEILEPIDSRPEHRFVVKNATTQMDQTLASGRMQLAGDRYYTQARQWLAKRYPDVEKMEASNIKALTQGDRRPVNPAVEAWHDVLKSYEEGKSSEFNAAVARYRGSLQDRSFGGVGMNRIGFECFFNSFQPFLLASMLYFLSFLVAGAGMLGFPRLLNRTAFAMIVLTFGLHMFALIARMIISGRPPVTNLYSTAVFIGWGIVLLSLIFERVYRLGVGNILASACGFMTLLIAHFLGGDGDTFTVLVAVLDTQFWLATHVTTINLGYATTFLSGMIGLMYLALRTPIRFAFAMSGMVAVVCLSLPSPIAETIESFTEISLSADAVKWGGLLAGLMGIAASAWVSVRPRFRNAEPLTPELQTNLSRMLYGTLCFGIFFSFVGTVLGGLWADDSWGRFWGWDPKENGALIIVLWNAVVLHARWGGMVKDRGMAVLSIGGNIATAWSWFGVNELGVGLHSYGFTEGILLALALFVISQLVAIVIGCLPKSFGPSANATA